MKRLKQVVVGLVWCGVSVGCVAEEVKPPVSSVDQAKEWRIQFGAEHPLCQSIYKLVGNAEDAEALHYSTDPLLKIQGVTSPSREEISGIEYYKIAFPNWSDKKASDVVLQIETKYPRTKWHRYKVDFDNNGTDEYVIQEEIPHYKYDSRIYLLKDKETIHPKSGNRYGRLIIFEGKTFIYRQDVDYYVIKAIENNGDAEVLYSTPSYCYIEYK